VFLVSISEDIPYQMVSYYYLGSTLPLDDKIYPIHINCMLYSRNCARTMQNFNLKSLRCCQYYKSKAQKAVSNLKFYSKGVVAGIAMGCFFGVNLPVLAIMRWYEGMGR
jgi:hypothetical protein